MVPDARLGEFSRLVEHRLAVHTDQRRVVRTAVTYDIPATAVATGEILLRPKAAIALAS